MLMFPLKTHHSEELRGPLADYNIGNTLGHGAYADVKLAIHKDTGKKFALKEYDKGKL